MPRSTQGRVYRTAVTRHFPVAKRYRDATHRIKLIKKLLHAKGLPLHFFHAGKFGQCVFQQILAGNVTGAIARLP